MGAIGGYNSGQASGQGLQGALKGLLGGGLLGAAAGGFERTIMGGQQANINQQATNANLSAINRNNEILRSADMRQQALMTQQSNYDMQQMNILNSQLAYDRQQAAANNAAATALMPAAMPNTNKLKNSGLRTVATSLQGVQSAPNLGSTGLLGN